MKYIRGDRHVDTKVVADVLSILSSNGWGYCLHGVVSCKAALPSGIGEHFSTMLHDIVQPGFRSALVGILSDASDAQTKRAVSSTRAPSSESSSRSFSADSHNRAGAASDSHATSARIPGNTSAIILLANVAEAIFQAYSASAEPSILEGHPVVVEICHLLAEPHLNDVIRKQAFERVVELVHKHVKSIAYVQEAQRTIQNIFKRFRTGH